MLYPQLYNTGAVDRSELPGLVGLPTDASQYFVENEGSLEHLVDEHELEYRVSRVGVSVEDDHARVELPEDFATSPLVGPDSYQQFRIGVFERPTCIVRCDEIDTSTIAFLCLLLSRGRLPGTDVVAQLRDFEMQFSGSDYQYTTPRYRPKSGTSPLIWVLPTSSEMSEVQKHQVRRLARVNNIPILVGRVDDERIVPDRVVSQMYVGYPGQDELSGMPVIRPRYEQEDPAVVVFDGIPDGLVLTDRELDLFGYEFSPLFLLGRGKETWRYRGAFYENALELDPGENVFLHHRRLQLFALELINRGTGLVETLIEQGYLDFGLWMAMLGEHDHGESESVLGDIPNSHPYQRELKEIAVPLEAGAIADLERRGHLPFGAGHRIQAFDDKRLEATDQDVRNLWIEAVFSRLADAVVGTIMFESYAIYLEEDQIEGEVAIRFRRIMDPLLQIYEMTLKNPGISRYVTNEMLDDFLFWIFGALSFQSDRRAQTTWQFGDEAKNPGLVYRYLIKKLESDERVVGDERFLWLLERAHSRLMKQLPRVASALDD